jgi:hypothetical protein
VEFTDHELMFIFDAVAHYAARPIFDDLPECEAFFLAVGEKCDQELKARGYSYKEDVAVDLVQR